MKDLFIENIVSDNINFAIILRNKFRSEGIRFFTSNNDSQQLGYMNRPIDYEILPHRHNLIPREVHLTQEVLFIKSGKVRVDFYSNNQDYLESRVLYPGDVILLSDGGHGFKMLEPSEIIEVKQGPYCGEHDKVRFDAIADDQIKLII
jgi:hypothetical protein